MRFSTTITNPNIIGNPLDGILDKIEAAGFDAVDFPGEPDIYPLDTSKEVLASHSNKLPVAEVTACINPTRCLMNPDEKARHKAVDYVKYCINAASELGVKLTHACFITTSELLQQTPPAILERAALDSLKTLARHAKDAGVRLMLEPLFSSDNTIVKTASKAVALFSKALGMDVETFMHGQRDFGLLLDIFHMHNEEADLLRAIQDHAAITMHVHVADHARSLDFTRVDSSFVRSAVAALRDTGYAGYISFESFHPSVSFDVLGSALRTIKQY
ncbi:MAG: sugar phosphate isomerase/epimerase [Candidatus Lokiarchaeota archaeon]|nr:sugar phosphate isomerase/epimerase [Candidatus Lokiarchaeota archaeon]